jgi:hypothetical protein
MTPHPHVIANQVLDLQIEDGGDALALQKEIRELFWREVVPVMSRLLDQWVPQEVVLHLDRLEIDLGRLDRGRLGEAFPARVSQVLESQLAALLGQESPDARPPPGGTRQQSGEEHALSLWHHLLANGYLPWWASRAAAAELEARIDELLASLDKLPDATDHLLRANAAARRRLALQGSAKTLEQVLRLADAALAQTSLPVLDAMLALLRAQPTVAIPAEHLREAWWEAALGEALRPSSTSTHRRLLGLSRQALVNAARKAAIGHADLLTRLRALVDPLHATAQNAIIRTHQRELLAVLRDIEEAGSAARQRRGLDASRQDHEAWTQEQAIRGASAKRGAPVAQDRTSPPEAEKAKNLSSTDRSGVQDGLQTRRDATEEPLPSLTNRPSTGGAGLTADPVTGPSDISEPGTSAAGDPIGPRAAEAARDPSGLRQPTAGPDGIAGGQGARHKPGYPPADGAVPRKDGERPQVSLPRGRTPPGGIERPERAPQQTEATIHRRASEGRELERDMAVPRPNSALPPNDARAGGGPTRLGHAHSREGEDADTGSPPPGDIQAEQAHSRAATSPHGVTGTSAPPQRPTVNGAEPTGRARSGAAIPAARSETPPGGDIVDDSSEAPGIPSPGARIREGETLYVEDAGIVLLHPFLQTHFEHLELVRDRGFVDEPARERAVHQLHFLATGEERPQEYRLVVAKILCGLMPDAPVARQVPINEDARSRAAALLAAVIRHWQALKNTSPDGLREAFLQRKGRLTRKADGWSLKVESDTLDILLYRLPDIQSRLPWSVSIVRLPWMPELLWVDWA